MTITGPASSAIKRRLPENGQVYVHHPPSLPPTCPVRSTPMVLSGETLFSLDERTAYSRAVASKRSSPSNDSGAHRIYRPSRRISQESSRRHRCRSNATFTGVVHELLVRNHNAAFGFIDLHCKKSLGQVARNNPQLMELMRRFLSGLTAE